MKMKNPFYLIGSIVSFLGGLAAEGVLYLMYVLISCADALSKQNGGTGQDLTGTYAFLLVLALAVFGSIVLAIITFIKSVRKKSAPLAMIIFQLLTALGLLVFAVNAVIGASGIDNILISILLIVVSVAIIVLYALGIAKDVKNKKLAKQSESESSAE